DVPGRVDLAGALVPHLVRRARQDPPAVHDVHVQGHEAPLEVALDAVGQLPRVARHPLAVEPHLAVHRDAELGQVRLGPHLPHAAGRRQEGLRRDAAAVHARAAHVPPGEDGRGQVLRPRVEGRAVPAHAAPDDDHVEVVPAALGRVEGRRRAGRSGRRAHGGPGGEGGRRGEQGRGRDESHASAGVIERGMLVDSTVLVEIGGVVVVVSRLSVSSTS
ncbi:hypothetical protein THAOC_19923, partial [Thalassiosira oceanica]